MEPKYKKLYNLLKAEILGGKYEKTQAFPSEAQLAHRYAYSRTTIRKALDELRYEGLIRSSQGKGTRVTDIGTTRTFGLILPGSRSMNISNILPRS